MPPHSTLHGNSPIDKQQSIIHSNVYIFAYIPLGFLNSVKFLTTVVVSLAGLGSMFAINSFFNPLSNSPALASGQLLTPCRTGRWCLEEQNLHRGPPVGTACTVTKILKKYLKHWTWRIQPKIPYLVRIPGLSWDPRHGSAQNNATLPGGLA